MKEIFSVLISAICVVALATGCGGGPLLSPTPVVPTQTASTNTEDARVPSNGEKFASILDAYAELERSGYTQFDEVLIGDSLLSGQGSRTYNFGRDAKPAIMYAFYDINADGLPELLIGAEESIAGIYALRNGKPVSVIQVEMRRNLDLLIDSDGNIVIEDSKGKMDFATEFFYGLSETGELVTLDKLYTNGLDIRDGEPVGYFHAKDVDGEEVSISGEEYCSLIQKYGAQGYGTLEEMRESSAVRLIWTPILTHE